MVATIVAEGRVAAAPGFDVTVGAERGGTISKVVVTEGAVVKAGDLLVQLRSDEIHAAAEEAVARVAEADAELTKAEREKARADRQASSGPDRDDARGLATDGMKAARARRDAAAAAYRRIAAEFARTRVRAPIAGVVVSRSVHPGETVATGAPMLRIVDLSRLVIEAEIDELDIPSCAPGQAVSITAEGHETSWPGHIESLSPLVQPRSMIPADPGRPTDARVLVARMRIDGNPPLGLGQHVEARIKSEKNSVIAAKIPLVH